MNNPILKKKIKDLTWEEKRELVATKETTSFFKV